MRVAISFFILIVLAGCQTTTQPERDYSAFRNANPASILVLPPINQTAEVIAPYGVMAKVTTPLAESGYYVFPVALVQQTFITNGLTVAEDAQAVDYQKLHTIFGADAALYITIQQYGTSYVILTSDTTVTLNAKLVDLRTGDLLWRGAASASSGEQRSHHGGGVLGMLVEAALTQIVETVSDRGFDIAGMATYRLLSSERPNGLLPGPRSRKFRQTVQ